MADSGFSQINKRLDKLETFADNIAISLGIVFSKEEEKKKVDPQNAKNGRKRRRIIDTDDDDDDDDANRANAKEETDQNVIDEKSKSKSLSDFTKHIRDSSSAVKKYKSDISQLHLGPRTSTPSATPLLKKTDTMEDTMVQCHVHELDTKHVSKNMDTKHVSKSTVPCIVEWIGDGCPVDSKTNLISHSRVLINDEIFKLGCIVALKDASISYGRIETMFQSDNHNFARLTQCHLYSDVKKMRLENKDPRRRFEISSLLEDDYDIDGPYDGDLILGNRIVKIPLECIFKSIGSEQLHYKLETLFFQSIETSNTDTDTVNVGGVGVGSDRGHQQQQVKKNTVTLENKIIRIRNENPKTIKNVKELDQGEDSDSDVTIIDVIDTNNRSKSKFSSAFQKNTIDDMDDDEEESEDVESDEEEKDGKKETKKEDVDKYDSDYQLESDEEYYDSKEKEKKEKEKKTPSASASASTQPEQEKKLEYVFDRIELRGYLMQPVDSRHTTQFWKKFYERRLKPLAEIGRSTNFIAREQLAKGVFVKWEFIHFKKSKRAKCRLTNISSNCNWKVKGHDDWLVSSTGYERAIKIAKIYNLLGEFVKEYRDKKGNITDDDLDRMLKLLK